MKQGLRPRWTPRNVNVHRHNLVDTSKRGVVLAEDASAYSAGTNRDHDSRFWHGLVGLQEGKLHIPGNWAGDQEHIGVTRRCNDVNAEAFKVVDRIVQGHDFEFASVA